MQLVDVTLFLRLLRLQGRHHRASPGLREVPPDFNGHGPDVNVLVLAEEFSGRISSTLAWILSC